PRGDCQRCQPSKFQETVTELTRWSYKGPYKPLQASLQTVSLTSIMTSNHTERGSPPQKVRTSHERDLISVWKGDRTEPTTLRATARRCLDPFHDPRLCGQTADRLELAIIFFVEPGGLAVESEA